MVGKKVKFLKSLVPQESVEFLKIVKFNFAKILSRLILVKICFQPELLVNCLKFKIFSNLKNIEGLSTRTSLFIKETALSRFEKNHSKMANWFIKRLKFSC